MKIIMVYNSRSGSALDIDDLREMSRVHGLTIDEVIPVKKGYESVLSPYIKKGATIAAVGGDGTLSSVAGQIAGTKSTFIPLPGGTLNHFTKDLNIPQNIEDALARIKSTKARRIDTVDVNGMTFINNSSIGLYPSSLRIREDLEGISISKWVVAIYAALRALFQFKTYKVNVNGQKFYTPFIFVGNNEYKLDDIGGTSRKQIDKGELSVFVAKTQSRMTLLRLAFFAIIGKAQTQTEFESYLLESVSIKSDKKRINISLDGEVYKIEPPINYKIMKKSLKII